MGVGLVAGDVRGSPPGVQPVLVVDGLVKYYGSLHAVRGISLELRRGEMLGFLGPNGAGKSTTIRCILDLLRPTAGPSASSVWTRAMTGWRSGRA